MSKIENCDSKCCSIANQSGDVERDKSDHSDRKKMTDASGGSEQFFWQINQRDISQLINRIIRDLMFARLQEQQAGARQKCT